VNLRKKILDFYIKFAPFLDLLSKKDKKSFFWVTVVQSLIAFLDIIGIYLVGIVAVLVASYLVGSTLNHQVLNYVNLIGFENYSTKFVIFIFSLITIIFFVFKTVFSIYVNQKILSFYAKKQSDFSTYLFSKIYNSSYVWLKKQNSERIYEAIAIGPNAIFVRIIGNSLMIFSDVLLLLFILAFLFIFNPIVSIFTFVFFWLCALVLQKIVGKKARVYGAINTESNIESHEYLNLALSSFKEIFVMNKNEHFRDGFQKAENLKATSSARILWIQMLPKYVFEIALTVGIFILSLSLLVNSIDNIATLTVFIVASGRIVPALFRIQSCILNLITSHSSALVTLQFLKDLQLRSDLIFPANNHSLENPPSIKLQSVSFKFLDSNEYLFKDVTIDIASGETVALVGKSGSGKTTLIDLILNIYAPSSGKIILKDGLRQMVPGNVTNISYVPQSPIIFKGSVLENIVFKKGDNAINEKALEDAIFGANLDDLIKRLPDGLQTELSNLNGILSGGEKQRIAIARALYMKPKLLVIDEGTSSLDYTSERFITESLKLLQGSVTIIIIAHRITTIKNVNKIFFMDEGKVIGPSNYDSLQNLIPEFSNWVKMINTEAGS
jgi:ABC-type multidrug transport system fused ATPase/permease subunit